MQTMLITLELEVEVTRGTPVDVAKDLASKYDGFQPYGDEFDYQITEAKARSAKVVSE